MLCTINENTIHGNLCMDAFRKLLRLPYKVYLMIRERFFLVSPPETHPPQPSSITGEGMGGDEFLQNVELVQKQPPCLSLEEEIKLVEKKTEDIEIPPPGHHPPHPSSIMGEGRGGDEFQQEYQLEKNKQFQTPPVYASGSGEVLVGKRTSDFEMPPLLEDQRISLCETLDRVLNTGVVVHGDITISVANIDLIYIGLRALLTSVETARQAGINHI